MKLPISLTAFAIAASLAVPATADVMLGAFDFDSSRFGNTLIESDGGAFSAGNWLNTVNANPGNPGYLTGANFNTGIANIGLSGALSYTIGYSLPIANGAGADLGIVVARFSTDNFIVEFSMDGTTFSAAVPIAAAGGVSSGEMRNYFYGGGGPFSSTLFVHSLDLSAFGFGAGDTLAAIRITGNTQLDLIRAAAFGDAVGVPEPVSLLLLGSGLLALGAGRRSRRSR